MPFKELPHTADWALRVWAADLAGLLAEAARGMTALSGAQTEAGQVVRRSLSLEAADAESLLVAFLGELAYLGEQEGLAYAGLPVCTLAGGGPFRLEAEVELAPARSVNKVIKAVTYHNLQVRPTIRGLEVEIVFDV